MVSSRKTDLDIIIVREALAELRLKHLNRLSKNEMSILQIITKIVHHN